MADLSTRQTDKKGRVLLPKSFADSTVIIETISETEVRIRRAVVIPEDEIVFSEEVPRKPLSDRDRDRFLELLDNPPQLTPTAKRAAQRYKKLCQSGKLKSSGVPTIEPASTAGRKV